MRKSKIIQKINLYLDGDNFICVRFANLNKRKSLGIKVDRVNWDASTLSVKGDRTAQARINEVLNWFEGQIVLAKISPITEQELWDRFIAFLKGDSIFINQKENKDSIDLSALIQSYIKKLAYRFEGNQISESTLSVKLATLNDFELFISYRYSLQTKISSLSNKFFKDYVAWCLYSKDIEYPATRWTWVQGQIKKVKAGVISIKQVNVRNTVITKLQSINELWTLAIELYGVNDLLIGLEIPKIRALKKDKLEYLSRADEDKLWEYANSGKKDAKFAMMFIFYCETSLSYKDTFALTKPDIQVTEDGIQFISKYREKTAYNDKAIKFAIPLSDRALQIIAYFDGKDKLLPFYTRQYINLKLKEIAQEIGIDTRIRGHIGRHTWNNKQEGLGVSEVIRMKVMGQKSISAHHNYTHQIPIADIVDGLKG